MTFRPLDIHSDRGPFVNPYQQPESAVEWDAHEPLLEAGQAAAPPQSPPGYVMYNKAHLKQSPALSSLVNGALATDTDGSVRLLVWCRWT